MIDNSINSPKLLDFNFAGMSIFLQKAIALNTMQKNNPNLPFNHAVHNFKTCLALKKLNNRNDWFITTTFFILI